jgi:Lar family restriction alleviation protein
MSELKLLPCPFCGGDATIGANEYYDGANTFYIYCTSCGVQQMTTKIRTDEAIAAWNRRAQPENEPLVRCGECIVPIADCPCGDVVMLKTDFCSYGKRKPERSEGE